MTKFKSPNCIDCGVIFSEEGTKRHALNRCQKCYSHEKYKNIKAFSPRVKEEYTHCRTCELEFDTLNHKGRLIKKGSLGYCVSCYTKLYNNRKEKRHCAKCNNILVNTTRDICKPCYRIKRDEFLRANPSARKTESDKNKVKAEKVVLDYEQFELIRRLLTKFKLGQNTSVDMFRVADIYLDIFNYDVFLDALSEKDQVIVMLKRLKDIWDKNNELKKQVMPKKRKYVRRANIEEVKN